MCTRAHAFSDAHSRDTRRPTLSVSHTHANIYVQSRTRACALTHIRVIGLVGSYAHVHNNAGMPASLGNVPSLGTFLGEERNATGER